MKIDFRQGIIRYQSDHTNTPQFLQKTANGNYINLIVSPDPTLISFAHYSANYLVEETVTVNNAWGPFPAYGQTQYLYWDISLLDGSLTRGFTTLPVLVNTLPPATPANNQHWFDTTDKVMKVWNGNKWLIKIRVFAGTYDSAGILHPNIIGSQVGISHGEYGTGTIIFGQNNKPLRESDGTFITTESQLSVTKTTGENIKFETALQYGQADTYIPKYSLVSYVSTPGHITLASHLNIDFQVHGLVIEEMYPGETRMVICDGVVRNEQWNWPTAKIGKPLFCGPTGEITATPPGNGISQQVGYIYDVDAIRLKIQLPVIL